MKNRRKYEPYNYYKKFKRMYKEFVLFIKNGEFYMTYDRDAKIVKYVIDSYLGQRHLAVDKREFGDLLAVLHKRGLNVVLAGRKKCLEYYSLKQSEYMRLWGKAKEYHRATFSSTHNNK